MTAYEELVRKMRIEGEDWPEWHVAADAIEALIREKDAAIRERDNVLAEMESFAKGMAEGAYARGYRDGLEKAAKYCQEYAMATPYNGTKATHDIYTESYCGDIQDIKHQGYGYAAAIRALIPE